ncbi:MAG: type VI secretion system-associated FHA domain protein TagH, partial [Pseudomonadota bacterium]
PSYDGARMRVTFRLSGGVTSESGNLMPATLDASGRPYLIGRSPDADWTLLDPSNRVSGIHLELRCEGSDLLLIDRSSGGTSLDHPANRLQKGQPTRLPDTATLHLPVGILTVTINRGAAGRLAEPRLSDDAEDVFHIAEIQRSRGLSGRLHFDGEDERGRLPSPDALAGGPSFTRPAPGAGPVRGAASALPDPSDLLGDAPRQGLGEAPTAMPAPPRRPAERPAEADYAPPSMAHQAPVQEQPRSAPAPSARPMGDSWLDEDEDEDALFGAPAERSVADDTPRPRMPDAPQDAEPAPGDPAAFADHGSPPGAEDAYSDRAGQGGYPASRGGHSSVPLDVTLPGGALASLAREAAGPQAAEIPVDRSFDPQRPTPDQPLSAPQGAGPDPALRAQFRQLGVDIDQLSPEAQQELAVEIARVFAAMADALHLMLKTRAETKRSLGITATEVEIGANPLKSVCNREAAVESLLRPLASGYLHGEVAVEDALQTMRHHQHALVTGIRAALQTSVKAFDPILMESKLEKSSMSRLVPAMRKAALWESFEENYAQFAEQARENFRMVIGRELDKLYERERGPTQGYPASGAHHTEDDR